MEGKESVRDRQKRETREQITRAARALMVQSGYENVTMRELALAAGVGLGTINLHFKDKKALLFSVFYDEIGQESLKAIQAVPQGGTLKAKFMSMIGSLFAYYEANGVFLRPVLQGAVFATGEWRERFDGQTADMAGLLVAIIDQHKVSGEVQASVSAHHLAMAIWSLYLTTLIDGLNRDRFDAQACLDKLEPLLDLVLSGATAQGGCDESTAFA